MRAFPEMLSLSEKTLLQWGGITPWLDWMGRRKRASSPSLLPDWHAACPAASPSRSFVSPAMIQCAGFLDCEPNKLSLLEAAFVSFVREVINTLMVSASDPSFPSGHLLFIHSKPVLPWEATSHPLLLQTDPSQLQGPLSLLRRFLIQLEPLPGVSSLPYVPEYSFVECFLYLTQDEVEESRISFGTGLSHQ